MSKILSEGLDFLNKAIDKYESSREGVPLFKLESGQKTTVRFLLDADKFVQWYEHRIVKRKVNYYRNIPCISDKEPCPLCMESDSNIKKKTYRFTTYIWNKNTKQVERIIQGIRVMTDLGVLYNKYGTLIDRDYEITRKGGGLDTKYYFIPESPTKAPKVDMKQFSELKDTIRIYNKQDIESIVKTYNSFDEENDSTSSSEIASF